MKMNQMMKRCVTFVIACVLAVSSVGVTRYPVETVEAATVQSITKSTQVVCKKTAKVKIPSGYKNCKFTSSNPKVATVDTRCDQTHRSKWCEEEKLYDHGRAGEEE